jgi:hypothetical protein
MTRAKHEEALAKKRGDVARKEAIKQKKALEVSIGVTQKCKFSERSRAQGGETPRLPHS